ncbi:MAG: hypothetical protein IT326_07155 [Anaerolineae bacterium]|nr:hypothetical protein [Anaerolineae bacterium]
MATSTLRKVLAAFEDMEGPATLADVARRLAVSPAQLDGMLEYWVRKGRLRASSSTESACASCGISGHCPFARPLPRRYELVEAGATIPAEPPVCCCGGAECRA